MTLRELILKKIEDLRPWSDHLHSLKPEVYAKLSDEELVNEFVEYIRFTFRQR